MTCEVFGCNGEEHHEYDPTCNAWVAVETCPTPAAALDPAARGDEVSP